MKRTAISVLLAAGLLLGACGGESSLPVATGKATITAINAIFGSPPLNFLIEERSLSSIVYKGTMSAASYDDLSYTFSFDTIYAGDTEFTRIASQPIDMVADQLYTILASGTLAAPVLTVWELPQRTFGDADTVFQTRFAHTSASLANDAIDIYFAADGVAPVLGEQRATLSHGEISDAVDLEAGAYVVIITRSGDPADVLFTSGPTTILARANLIITPFDGDANDLTPLVVRGLREQGGSVPFHDWLAQPTVQFLHTAMEMGSTDVYDDAALNSQILSNHAFRDLTADQPVAAGSHEYFYTPAGSTTAVLLQTPFDAAAGLHHRVTALGTGGVYVTSNSILNRRAIDTAAKLLYYVSTTNFDFTDLYVVDSGTTIEEQAPRYPGVASLFSVPPLELEPGSYDFYITEFGEKEVLAGPFAIDLAFGDVVDMVVFDTSDPAVLDMVVFPIP